MQPTGTVWTTLIGDTKGSFLWSLVKIHQVVLEEMLFKEIVDARTHGHTDARAMDDGQWAITKAHLEHFVLRWAKNILKTFFDPVTYLCNQSEPF